MLLNLSREIRIPLHTILGFATILKDLSLNEQERIQFLQRIILNGDELLQLFDEVLNFSQVEVGEIVIEKVKFNFSELVFDIILAMNSIAAKKEINLQACFVNAIPEWIQSDPHRVRQIMTTLIGNAIRYTSEKGRVQISMQFQQHYRFGASLIVEVEDTGLGIPENQKEKIFEPFSQLTARTDRSSHGGRLGLALADRLAESLGGKLSLKGSEVGKGSCFSLILPTGDLSGVEFIRARPKVPLARRLIGGILRHKRLENVRVLLAEDSEDNETLVHLYLVREGALISHAHNGLEVLSAVKDQTFDIILMDIQMPLMDGLATTRRLREDGFQKPILALTAHAFKEDVERSLKAGCSTHLIKPIRGEELIEEIRKRVV
jgi:hypothetical protein